MLENNASKEPEYLTIGEIIRPHGVRGELRMRIITDYPEHLHEIENIYLSNSSKTKNIVPKKLVKVRFHKDYALLTLKDCKDRSDADKLRNQLVMIAREDAVPLEDGEYYLFQLVGLTIVSDQQEIGVVKEVLETGANDVYIIESDQYGEVLLPAHSETIQNIDFASKTIHMTIPEGLLPSP